MPRPGCFGDRDALSVDAGGQLLARQSRKGIGCLLHGTWFPGDCWGLGTSKMDACYSDGGYGMVVDSARRASGNIVEFEVPGRPNMLWKIRSRVSQFARSMPFSEDEVDDITLAVGEAGSNAVKHAAALKSCRILIKMERHKDSIRIHVIDTGCGFDPNSISSPDPLSETGRGISVMRAVMDEVRFHPGSGGTHVELVKHLHGGRTLTPAAQPPS